LSRRRSAQRHTALACALATAAVVVGTPVDTESARWWRSRRVVAALALSKAQIARIDAAYERELPTLLKAAQRTGIATASRHRLVANGAGEAVRDVRAAEAVDSIDRTRQLVLERLYLELTPAQLQSCRWLRVCM
jgi:hypothetical protein